MDPMLAGVTLLLVVAGYALGCINTGYYLVRARTGQDIRTLGSGNAGARNVGRVLGRGGFALTLVGDVLKGMPAVLTARWAGLPEWVWVVALLATLAGHIWPLQLRGRGGKGAATALGGVLAFNPLVGAAALVVLVILRAITRQTVVSGALAAASIPLWGWLLGLSETLLLGIGCLLLLLLWTHRDNLRRVVVRDHVPPRV